MHILSVLPNPYMHVYNALMVRYIVCLAVTLELSLALPLGADGLTFDSTQ